MTARYQHKGTGRIAHVGAILVFALAQFISTAHAEECHDAHTSHEDCLICCLAVADDDFDVPASAVEVGSSRLGVSSVELSTLNVVIDGSRSLPIIRGPPQN